MSEVIWARLGAKKPALGLIAATYNALQPADFAAMLGGLSQRKFLAGMLILAGDESVMRELEKRLFVRSIMIAADQDWPLPTGPKPLRRLSKLVLVDAMARGAPCPTCKAKGYRVAEGTHIYCDTCRGVGKRPFMEKELCELSGIPIRSWTRTWGERYSALHTDFWSDVDDARRYLARKMRAERAV